MTSNTDTIRAYVVSRVEVDVDTKVGGVAVVRSSVVRSKLGLELAQLGSPSPIEIITFEASKKECPFRSKDKLVWALGYVLQNAIFHDRPKSYAEIKFRLHEFARDADLDVKYEVLAYKCDSNKPLITFINPIRYDPQFDPPLYP